MKRFEVLLLCFLLVFILPKTGKASSDSSQQPDQAVSIAANEESAGSPESARPMMMCPPAEKEPKAAEVKTEGEGEAEEEQEAKISDPLESLNRSFFSFNDKLYFYVLKPVAQGYGKVLPKRVRISIRDFFSNAYAPVRMVSCGLQGDGKGTCTELARFLTNTTVGLAGFFDPATSWLKLKMRDEDFGQTMGCLMGPGFYLNLPFWGPSSLRDGTGSVVDFFIVPSYYVIFYLSWYVTAGPSALQAINNTSLTIGDYEQLTNAAIDPYIAVRNAYFQYRKDMIKR